jgi:hypothetical protein
MDKNIFEEGPRRGHAAGDTSLEQQASQLASDIKYKARQKMKGKSGSNMSPGQVQQLYRSLLGSSTAPGGVKAIVKKKLFGEQIDPGIVPVSEHVKESSSYVFSRVFLEADEKKFVIKVTDRATGNTSYRKADRAKIAELRANKNISSVEITGRKEVDDAYKGDPKPNYDGKKAKKDYDGDGKVESGSKEHAGAVHNAIQRKKGGVPDGKDTRKEEFIYEKEGSGEKKLDVMKGKNVVKINPTIGESIRAELDALKAQKVEEEAAAAKAAGPTPEERQQLMNKDKMLKKKIMMQKQSIQMQKQGKLPLNYNESLGEMRYCPKCDKDETRDECKYGGEYWDENSKPAKDEDPRGNYAKINLAKNKLRAMGLKMSYDVEGNMTEEASDRARDEHQMRGGMAARKDYDRPPAKKLSNKELGIKPGKTWVQKQMEKKKQNKMTEARNPEVEAQGKKIAGYEREGRAAALVSKFRKENPGSRQAKKVPGAKETEGDAANRRRIAQARRAAKQGLTSRERRESQARAKYDSPRD